MHPAYWAIHEGGENTVTSNQEGMSTFIFVSGLCLDVRYPVLNWKVEVKHMNMRILWIV